MSPTMPVRAVFVSCLLMLCSGAAMGGMYECVDPAGATTYTDMPCKDGDDMVRPAGVVKMNNVAATSGSPGVAKQVSESKAIDRKLKQRSLATDRATLQAASDAIMTSDRVSALEPRQAFSRSY